MEEDMATGKAPDNPRHVAAAVCCAAVLGLWPALALEVRLSPRGLQFPELGIPLDAHQAGSDSFGCAELYLRMQETAGNLDSFDRVYSF